MQKVTRLFVALSLVAASVAGAQQPRPVAGTALVITAVNTSASSARARGETRDSLAHPGDVIRYKLTFTNTVGRPIQRVELKDPLPAGLQFVAGSATSSRDDAKLEFSADSGRTFSAQPMEQVTINGQTVERPVPAERYTHVRWTVGGWVQPKAVVTAQFEARVTNGASASTSGQSAAPSKPAGR